MESNTLESLQKEDYIETTKLDKNDYTKTTLRSYFLQSSFNYTTYQGIGYLYVILPALRKIYKDDEETLKEVALGNLEFYNTNPHLLPFGTSMHLTMFENGSSAAEARPIKTALMGPLAGIGDSIAQFGLAPLFSTIFAGLALNGMTIAPLLFWFAMIVSMLAIKLVMGDLGYRLGTSIIDTLSEQINKIASAANIVGVTVISALATQFVNLNLGIEYRTTLESGEEQIVAFQEIFDQIMPNMLPVVLTVFVYYLIRKKGWNTYQLLGLLFVIGILGSVTGILQ